ncbi:BING4CT-domain-containing protein [Leucogyrophana mollusca]|uniref:BING4CT-domain-containing protein n=1 Tax=Leucogyrophana mollusca TaxID=85980 RepID=A0ACB8BE92_9AGAM|nr:BING4CT-domain-containing protein [Leucogyrophana mollusca]
MDSLFAKAEAIQPLEKKRKGSGGAPNKKSHKPNKPAPPSDRILTSVAQHTALPKSLRPTSPTPENVSKHTHIKDLKLRTQLTRQATHAARSKALLQDAELLLTDEVGKIQAENDMERTWRIGQDEVVQGAGQEAAKGRQEWKLDGGPYRSRYTRNGRHLAIVGNMGHVATFDWQTGSMHAELQLQETCRDITFLHDHSHFAVAQKKYVFIYDRDGVELHRLKSHIESTRLEFLPYHWLLASVGNSGYLKYQDTSTGQLVAEHRTKLGACHTMTQNRHNAVIHLGHQSGVVTLWTPNLPHPAVQLLAHLGPVVGVSVDPSTGGRYMATSGQDGIVKVWDCRNWKGAIREWSTRGGGAELEWSAKGSLAVATGGSVNVYTRPTIQSPFSAKVAPPLYLTHPIPHRPLTSVRFCPFQDILTIGHNAGLSSILVPGSGEPNFDSAEADPFENKKARREREVKGLLDKIQPDMIALDPDFVGSLAPPLKLTTAVNDKVDIPFAHLPRLERLRLQGKADESEIMDGDDADGSGDGEDGSNGKKQSREEREKRKMRGKGKSLKRYLRKQRKNVIDPTAVSIRAKLEKQKEEKRVARAIEKGEMEPRKPSALDRFRRS